MLNNRLHFIFPRWPVLERVCSASTTRMGGFSQKPFDHFNLATHVGDDVHSVIQNRQLLKQALSLPTEPLWLEQIHSSIVIDASQAESTTADGAYTNQPGIVCAVMTADCLPILLCNRTGTEVAAVHGGWKGLSQEIIQNALSRFRSAPQDIFAWLGPAIGPNHFEVGDDVRHSFIRLDSELAKAFVRSHPNHGWMANLRLIATLQLQRQGITEIFSEQVCTFDNYSGFYSYRRNNQTGRMASLIWLSA